MAVNTPTEHSGPETPDMDPTPRPTVRTGRRRVTKGAIAAAGAVTAYAVPVATRVAHGQRVGSPPPMGATPTPTTTTGQGCTPGYWKQQQHFDSWEATPYDPTDTLESVFDVPDSLGIDNTTLVGALDFGGGSGVAGGARILLRAAVAAILNAAHPSVNYAYENGTAQNVIDDVNAALASNNRDQMIALAGTLDDFNNDGCPLN